MECRHVLCSTFSYKEPKSELRVVGEFVMTRKIVSETSKVTPSGADPVFAYARGLAAADAAICKALRAEIDEALPGAVSRVWHGAPVWFVGTTPVVGYNVTSRGGVNLLFWNGQAFKDPVLKPIGKFKAAQVHFDDVAEIGSKSLRRWLTKARADIWDYRAIRTKAAR